MKERKSISRVMGCSLGLCSDVAMAIQWLEQSVVCFPCSKGWRQDLEWLVSFPSQSAGSCFLLPDLSGRMESHLLPISPSSQGDTVGKATSCWPECMRLCVRVCSVYT